MTSNSVSYPKPDAPWTGWIRYKIGSKASAGTWKYVYVPWANRNDTDELRDWIIREPESWAQFSYSYSLDIETDVNPPLDVLLKRIEQAKQSVENAARTLAVLQSQVPTVS